MITEKKIIDVREVAVEYAIKKIHHGEGKTTTESLLSQAFIEGYNHRRKHETQLEEAIFRLRKILSQVMDGEEISNLEKLLYEEQQFNKQLSQVHNDMLPMVARKKALALKISKRSTEFTDGIKRIQHNYINAIGESSNGKERQ